jgi:four helix bundle protein
MVGMDSPLRPKSYDFALAIVKEVRRLRETNREFELTGQLVRSATSVGANVEEAGAGQTKKDFITKMAIAAKEANESRYWLRLLRDGGILDARTSERLIADCDEIVRMLTATVKTAQTRISRST